MLPSDFFFLRPLWLLLLIPAAGLTWLAVRGGDGATDSAWSRLVDPHLLAALSVTGTKSGGSRWLPALLGAALLAAIVAMAGPTWQKIQLPTYDSKTPVVVAMSLAQSMNADDIKPTRLTRAGHKLRDILRREQGGDIGLVIYSDRPFVAAPLTEDGAVIRQMLPELSTDLMPVLGNRPDLAIKRSAELLKEAGAGKARIILLADSAGSNPKASVKAASAAWGEGYQVEVIGIGKNKDAMLRTASGAKITTRDGKAMQAGFDPAGLQRIAEAGGGLYTRLTADQTDVDLVLPQLALTQPGTLKKEADFKADGWADMGYWLLLIPVLLAPLAFRRNLLFAVPLAFLLLAGVPMGRAEAGTLSNLWQTPDQQGATAFADKNYRAAARRFENGSWRAAALYRAGDYAAAAKAYARSDKAAGAYNRGNALAKAGNLKAALAAYDEALKAQPDNADAKFNRDLVKKLLEQQKQKQQKKQQKQANQQRQQKQKQGGNGQQQKQPQKGGKGQNRKQAQQNKASQGQNKQTPKQRAGSGQQQKQNQKQANGQQGGKNGKPQAKQQQSANGDKQQRANAQQNQGGQTKPQQPGKPQQQARHQKQTKAQAQAANKPKQQEKSAFQKAMDAMLKGNGGKPAQPQPKAPPARVAASRPGITEQQQADEQLLRSVPDDASGLLRARINQYYARYR